MIHVPLQYSQNYDISGALATTGVLVRGNFFLTSFFRIKKFLDVGKEPKHEQKRCEREENLLYFKTKSNNFSQSL